MSATAALAHLLGRKGAARIALIPPQVLDALHAGQIATVNLNEFLAIDLTRLAPVIASQIGLDPGHERLQDTLAMLSAFPPVKRHAHVALALYDITAALDPPTRNAVATALARHPSDIARCWATHWVRVSGLALPQRLQALRPLAADPHFGVREMAWMAARDTLVDQLDEALRLLQPWVQSPDPCLRRFACELTRPRGVWCAHLEALKTTPALGLPLLEPLRCDGSRYVQNSVANWLNDAAKTQPAWVQALCARWSRESPGPATRYITQHAQRGLIAGAL